MRGLILALLLSSCAYGLSAAATIGLPDVYCQPVAPDVQICRGESWYRDDYPYYNGEYRWPYYHGGRTWRCVINQAIWECTEVPWWVTQ